MSKYSEMLAIMEFAKNAGKDKEPKRWRKKKEPDFINQLVEYQEKVEKFNKWLKTQDKEKKTPTSPFTDWSVAQKTAFFTILGPPMGIAYIFCIVLLVRGLATFVVGSH